MPSSIIKEQDRNAVIKDLALRLLNVAKLYSLEKYADENAVILATWIYNTYSFDTLETVQRVLSNPPKGETVWRLTPDTITNWMAIELERQASEREKQIHNAKVNEGDKFEWSDERLAEWESIIDKAEGFSRGPALSEEEIKEEGRERPKKYDHAVYQTSQEEAVVKALHLEWIKANHDAITGKPLAGWMAEEEWIRLNS